MRHLTYLLHFLSSFDSFSFLTFFWLKIGGSKRSNNLTCDEFSVFNTSILLLLSSFFFDIFVLFVLLKQDNYFPLKEYITKFLLILVLFLSEEKLFKFIFLFLLLHLLCFV